MPGRSSSDSRFARYSADRATKRCPRCEQELPVSEFRFKMHWRGEHRYHVCRECDRASRRDRRASAKLRAEAEVERAARRATPRRPAPVPAFWVTHDPQVMTAQEYAALTDEQVDSHPDADVRRMLRARRRHALVVVGGGVPAAPASGRVNVTAVRRSRAPRRAPTPVPWRRGQPVPAGDAFVLRGSVVRRRTVVAFGHPCVEFSRARSVDYGEPVAVVPVHAHHAARIGPASLHDTLSDVLFRAPSDVPALIDADGRGRFADAAGDLVPVRESARPPRTVASPDGVDDF